jgi:hypothetical protein
VCPNLHILTALVVPLICTGLVVPLVCTGLVVPLVCTGLVVPLICTGRLISGFTLFKNEMALWSNDVSVFAEDRVRYYVENL